MTCPKCNSTRIAIRDSVNNTEENETYRKRVCADCGRIFHTVEFEVEYNDRFKKEWHKYYRTGR